MTDGGTETRLPALDPDRPEAFAGTLMDGLEPDPVDVKVAAAIYHEAARAYAYLPPSERPWRVAEEQAEES